MRNMTHPTTTIPWRDQFVERWSEDRPVESAYAIAEGRRRGLPPTPPEDPEEAVKLLWAAGFTELQIFEATLIGPVQQRALLNADEKIPEAIELHALGMSVQEVAEETGLKRPTIYYHLRKLGVRPNTRKRMLTARERDEIIEQYLDGEPLVKIARRLQIHPDTVRKTVNRRAGK